MNAVTTSIGEAMAEPQERTMAEGAPSVKGLEHLLERTRGIVEGLRDPDRATGSGHAGGQGQAGGRDTGPGADGEFHGGDRVEASRVDARALAMEAVFG